MERVALYLRSTKDRHDVSVEAQRRELTAHAESKSYVTNAVFEDKVQSAKTDERPAFQEMIAEAGLRDKRFDVILCLDTSRFARNATDAKIYKEHLRGTCGVRVEFVKMPTTDSYIDPLIETLMEGIDQLHSQKSKSDGLRGMKQNVLKGFRAGGSAPIGYKLDKIVTGIREGVQVTKSKLIRDPEKFTVIQEYLERRASGHSRPDAASLTGLDISTGTFVGIEDNALVYAGHTVWFRHNEKIKGGYRGGIKVRPRDEWVVQPNTHEAMISDGQAEIIMAQRALKSASQQRGRRSPYLLAGLLRCVCGANYDGDAGYYKCHRRKAGCGSRSIRQETIERAVLGVLFEQYLTVETLAGIREQLIRLESTTGARHKRDIEGLGAQLKDVTRQIDTLIALLTEVEQRRPYLTKIDELETQRVALAKRLQATVPSGANDLKSWDDDSLRSFVARYRSEMQFGDPESKKSIVRSLVASASLDGDDLTLVPNYPGFTGVKMASPRGFEPRFSP
jgi:site-specific DNA recombinase